MKTERIALLLVTIWVATGSVAPLQAGSDARKVTADHRVVQEVAPTPPPPPMPPPFPEFEDLPGFFAQAGSGGYLGVSVEDITAETVKELGLHEERGVLIREVRENSAAAKAGLKPKDVVVNFNGTRLEGLTQFTRLLRETPAGRTITLGIIRDKRDQEIRVTLGSRSKDGRVLGGEIHVDVPDIKIDSSKWPSVIWPMASRGRLGAQIQVLTEQLAQYFGVPDKQGLLVTSVNTDSPASRAGIKAGDVITAIEDQPIHDAESISRALRDKEGDVKVTIVRDRQQQTVRVTLQPREAPRRIERRVVTTPRVKVVRRPPTV